MGKPLHKSFFCGNFPHSLRLIVPQLVKAEGKLRE